MTVFGVAAPIAGLMIIVLDILRQYIIANVTIAGLSSSLILNNLLKYEKNYINDKKRTNIHY